MLKLKKLTYIFTFLSFLTYFSQANAEIKVVASIKPIHSLASYLMDGVKKPDLIVDGYASPHGFAMKPSHAKMLQEADLIFWVGEDIESFLVKPLGSIAKKAEKIELMEIKGIKKLKFIERNILMDMMIMDIKKTIMTIMMIMLKRKMVMTITIMIKTSIKKTDMTITVMRVMHTASLTHTYG